MGLDFIYRRAKSFTRKWDRGRDELAKPNLFANELDVQPRTCTATPTRGQHFSEGQDYIVTPAGPDLRVTLGTQVVGIVKSPPKSVSEAIKKSGSSIALGRAERVHPVSQAADLSIR